MTINWEKQEPGWYTSPLGGIYDESTNKWYFYPIKETGRVGPFKTLARAKEAAAAHSNGERQNG